MFLLNESKNNNMNLPNQNSTAVTHLHWEFPDETMVSFRSFHYMS